MVMPFLNIKEGLENFPSSMTTRKKEKREGGVGQLYRVSSLEEKPQKAAQKSLQVWYYVHCLPFVAQRDNFQLGFFDLDFLSFDMDASSSESSLPSPNLRLCFLSTLPQTTIFLSSFSSTGSDFSLGLQMKSDLYKPG